MSLCGMQVPFAYEEAIGYCVGDLIKDKDGVRSVLLLCCTKPSSRSVQAGRQAGGQRLAVI